MDSRASFTIQKRISGFGERGKALRHVPRAIAGVLAAAALVSGSVAEAAADWQAQLAQALGKSGKQMPGGIYRVALPRTDLHATLDGVVLKPGFALGGWLAFEKAGNGAMVMGDLVLTMDEVNPS